MLPQIIYLILVFFAIGAGFVKFPEKIQLSFTVQVFCKTVALALLLWGGFFDAFFK